MMMGNLTKSLGGPSLYAKKKNDIISGNKMRKNEFYMADVKEKNVVDRAAFDASYVHQNL